MSSKIFLVWSNILMASNMEVGFFILLEVEPLLVNVETNYKIWAYNKILSTSLLLPTLGPTRSGVFTTNTT